MSRKKKEEVLFSDGGLIEKHRDVFGVLVIIISFLISFALIFIGTLAIMN